jgi:hypothetical protein
MRQSENYPDSESVKVNLWITIFNTLINHVLTLSVLDIRISGFSNVAREKIPETQNCEKINYPIIDSKF